MATKLLANQLRSILNDPVEGFTVEADETNFFEWKVWIEGPKDTCYAGGVFQLCLKFPKDYPMSPPELRYVSDFWHPNVFANGKVCMSILHPPGEDVMSGELPEERWLPTQSVTTIILSLMSLLNDPNCASPANVDASVEWRNHREAFKNRCHKLVEKANRECPPHVVIPHPESDADQHKRRVQKFHEMNKDLDYDDFYDNDAEAGDDDDNNDDDDESGDENEFLESEGDEINTDDEQSPTVPVKETKTRSRSGSNAGSGVKKEEKESVHLEVVQTEVKKEDKGKGKGKAKEENSGAEQSEEDTHSSSTTHSSTTTSAATANISASVTAQPSSSSTNPSPLVSPSAPTPLPSENNASSNHNNNANSSNNSNSHNNNTNNNNNNNNVAPPVSHKKSKKGKKGKKCVIM